MFLRIDKVTGVNNAPPIPSSNDSSSPPLHACLATAVTRQKEEETVEKVEGTITDDDNNEEEKINEFNASGELFVVGRKNAAVTIDDKVRFLSLSVLLFIALWILYCF